MNIIDRVQRHYDDLGRKSIDVPEWGEDNTPLKIYWTPLTALQHRKIVTGEDGRTAKLLVSVLIMKAEDGDGRRIFKEEDRGVLMSKVDLHVITRVANAILAERTIEELEKN
ncbi:hypothetical protein SAMN02745157_0699 [Kaistia soli DSM 19436]|uniref:Uncharacterized protein n=1 Tax=Kaistia soli DSM 19436 TaxID=1122133 RepID=A0A1M4VGN2_9HYPH|nr:hypothetical protein [Kaistia soli]SHE68098.1 hypothetical protein SAMN02745157_0699 [Kaistia soli DSM 19436]